MLSSERSVNQDIKGIKCCGKPEVTLHVHLQCDGLTLPQRSPLEPIQRLLVSSVLQSSHLRHSKSTNHSGKPHYYNQDQAEGIKQKNGQMKLFRIRFSLSHLQHQQGDQRSVIWNLL